MLLAVAHRQVKRRCLPLDSAALKQICRLGKWVERQKLDEACQDSQHVLIRYIHIFC